MKKLIFGLITQLAFLPAAYGLYSGNPADPMLGNEGIWFNESPCWWSPKIGFQRDYITDRKLCSKDLPNRRVDEFEIVSDQGTIAFDFCQRYEIYGTVGTGRLFTRNRPDNLVATNFQTHRDWEFKDGTVWSIGGKAIVFDWCNTIFTVDAKYSEFFARAAWDGIHTGPVPTAAKIEYREWQASIGAAYNYCCVVPYITLNFAGTQGSRICGVQDNPADAGTTSINSYKLNARRLVGLSIGTTFSPVNSFYVTWEAQIINERALTLQGVMKF